MPPPDRPDLFPGALELMVLQTLRLGPLHGYALAQTIKRTSDGLVHVEEGSLYPALQKLLLNGWVKASWTISESGREVREYRLTPSGRKQLDLLLSDYRRVSQAIAFLLDRA